ncbi:MAG: hypothetical protein ACO3ZD_07925, partial [Cyanobium sp.]
IAAETAAGVNQVAWRSTLGNELQFWSLDATWNWQSSTGPWDPSSSAAMAQEKNFLMDFNRDGVVGSSL